MDFNNPGQAHQFKSIAAEDFRPGYRYWPVRPGREWAWTIESVKIGPADHLVYQNGHWTHPDIVTITRRDGDVSQFEIGQQVTIQGPWYSGYVPQLPPSTRAMTGTLTELRAQLLCDIRSADGAHSAAAQQWADEADRISDAIDQAAETETDIHTPTSHRTATVGAQPWARRCA